MPGRLVRFKQVDVFTSVPFKGNALAVVFDADSLGDDDMLAIAAGRTCRKRRSSARRPIRKPTTASGSSRRRANCRSPVIRRWAPRMFLESGARRAPGRLDPAVRVGRVAREQADGWAFAAPPARVTPLDRSDYAALAAALRSDALDLDAEPCAVDNGAPWLVMRLKSADACIGLTPDPAALAALTHRYGTDGIAVYAPHGRRPRHVRNPLPDDGRQFRLRRGSRHRQRERRARRAADAAGTPPRPVEYGPPGYGDRRDAASSSAMTKTAPRGSAVRRHRRRRHFPVTRLTFRDVRWRRPVRRPYDSPNYRKTFQPVISGLIRCFGGLSMVACPANEQTSGQPRPIISHPDGWRTRAGRHPLR